MGSRAARIDRDDHTLAGEVGSAVAVPTPADPVAAPAVEQPIAFGALYDREAAFVWRTLRFFGVAPANIEDGVQDVFLVVHRRLADFEGRSAVRTWIYAIAQRVALNYRRGQRRRGHIEPMREDLGDPGGRDPRELAETAEAGRLLCELVGRLDEDKREVFVLAEVEQMSIPEVSDLLGINLNTAYSRLRAARIAFRRDLALYRGEVGRAESVGLQPRPRAAGGLGARAVGRDGGGSR